jgi:16S rRNA (guanine1207-N2)-methyltransferase
VFSPDGLDQGTATLLRHLAGLPVPGRAADLGCGAGHLGLALARRGAAAWLMDADHRAVSAATANANALGITTEVAWADAEDPWPRDFDLVVANPPAHRGTAVDLGPGTALLAKGVEALAPGGRLLAVANRQLAYERVIARFGSLTVHDRGPFKILELRRG